MKRERVEKQVLEHNHMEALLTAGLAMQRERYCLDSKSSQKTLFKGIEFFESNEDGTSITQSPIEVLIDPNNEDAATQELYARANEHLQFGHPISIIIGHQDGDPTQPQYALGCLNEDGNFEFSHKMVKPIDGDGFDAKPLHENIVLNANNAHKIKQLINNQPTAKQVVEMGAQPLPTEPIFLPEKQEQKKSLYTKAKDGLSRLFSWVSKGNKSYSDAKMNIHTGRSPLRPAVSDGQGFVEPE